MHDANDQDEPSQHQESCLEQISTLHPHSPTGALTSVETNHMTAIQCTVMSATQCTMFDHSTQHGTLTVVTYWTCQIS